MLRISCQFRGKQSSSSATIHPSRDAGPGHSQCDAAASIINDYCLFSGENRKNFDFISWQAAPSMLACHLTTATTTTMAMVVIHGGPITPEWIIKLDLVFDSLFLFLLLLLFPPLCSFNHYIWNFFPLIVVLIFFQVLFCFGIIFSYHFRLIYFGFCSQFHFWHWSKL